MTDTIKQAIKNAIGDYHHNVRSLKHGEVIDAFKSIMRDLDFDVTDPSEILSVLDPLPDDEWKRVTTLLAPLFGDDYKKSLNIRDTRN